MQLLYNPYIKFNYDTNLTMTEINLISGLQTEFSVFQKHWHNVKQVLILLGPEQSLVILVIRNKPIQIDDKWLTVQIRPKTFLCQSKRT